MTNDRTPHLWFAGLEPRAYSLIAPIDSTAERGAAGHGGFVLEHQRDRDTLVMFLTVENAGNAPEPVRVSVPIPGNLVRALLDKVPEASARSGSQEGASR